jgi:hypothetical protein
MTLIVFIYVYYRLFGCINLIDVMLLFFTIFSFYLSIFGKIHPISSKKHPEITTMNFREIVNLSVKSAD